MMNDGNTPRIQTVTLLTKLGHVSKLNNIKCESRAFKAKDTYNINILFLMCLSYYEAYQYDIPIIY